MHLSLFWGSWLAMLRAYSWITLGWSQRLIWGAGDRSGAFCVQNKYLSCCPSFLAFIDYLFLNISPPSFWLPSGNAEIWTLMAFAKVKHLCNNGSYMEHICDNFKFLSPALTPFGVLVTREVSFRGFWNPLIWKVLFWGLTWPYSLLLWTQESSQWAQIKKKLDASNRKLRSTACQANAFPTVLCPLENGFKQNIWEVILIFLFTSI